MNIVNLCFICFLLFSAITINDISCTDFIMERLQGPKTLGLSFDSWIKAMELYKYKERASLNISLDINDKSNIAYKELDWAIRSHVQTQTLIHDRWFYNVTTNEYTVNSFLDKLIVQYGGIDEILLWPAYPNIGVDGRNQYDLLRSMPGGITQLKKIVKQFQQRNVKVLLPFNPWDTGTRDEFHGAPMILTLLSIIDEVGADGLNGDTMRGVHNDVFEYSYSKYNKSIAIEPELNLGILEEVKTNIHSWSYWGPFTTEPYVSKYKWLHPLHQPHICERWHTDHTGDIQQAFFNAAGFVAWQNVWSIYNKLTDRDAELTRRMSTFLKLFTELFATTSTRWVPFAPVTLHENLFASQWSNTTHSLVLLVNRNSQPLHGPLVNHTAVSKYFAHQANNKENWTCFDIYHGTTDCNSASMDANDIAGLLFVNPTNAPPSTSTLEKMNNLTSTPIGTYSSLWKPLPQRVVDITPTEQIDSTPSGMTLVSNSSHPEAPLNYLFAVSGIEIEGDNDPGVDVQYPWEEYPTRYHNQYLLVAPFLIDNHLVTNSNFSKFMSETNYVPSDPGAGNFLRSWSVTSVGDKKHYKMYSWQANQPATWVGLNDARAYCAWQGKRLPHEWEWQLAAQGVNHPERPFPWGQVFKYNNVPNADYTRSPRPPSNITDANAQGCSRAHPNFCNIVGNVWQWTDEFVDEHTRCAVLKGGSYYYPQGSTWYFPQTQVVNNHGKLLLMAPSMDRSGMIGFRCVKDVKPLSQSSTLPKAV